MSNDERLDAIREAMWRLNELWPVLTGPSTTEQLRALGVAMGKLSSVVRSLEEEKKQPARKAGD
jgi:hypothetical protein